MRSSTRLVRMSRRAASLARRHGRKAIVPAGVPSELVVALAFVGLLVLGAVFAEVPAARHVGLVPLCLLAATASWWASLSGAAVVGLMTWPFYLGCVVGTAGDLALPGRPGLLALATLLVAAVGSALTRHVLTWPDHRRAAKATRAGTAATLYFPAIPPYPAIRGDSAVPRDSAMPRHSARRRDPAIHRAADSATPPCPGGSRQKA